MWLNGKLANEIVNSKRALLSKDVTVYSKYMFIIYNNIHRFSTEVR